MSGNAEKSAAGTSVRPAGTQRWRGLPDAFRDARLCYDHLAGVLGVTIAKALMEQGALVQRTRADAVPSDSRPQACIPSDEQWQLGQHAPRIFGALGVDLAEVQQRPTRRPLLRTCLDWTEQEPHLAGHLGAMLADSLLAQGWITRQPAGRAITLTAEGRRMLDRRLFLPH